jgi:hypothetical protein
VMVLSLLADTRARQTSGVKATPVGKTRIGAALYALL